MFNTSFVSVIIPSLNRKDFVVNLLGDLAKQTFRNFEVIIVDQSKEPYNLPSDICRYYSVNFKGPCIARQFAIEKSVGDVLVFLDDDARIEENFLESLTKPIIKSEEIATCGAICDEFGNYRYKNFEERFNQNINKTFSADIISLLTANPNCPESGYSLSFPTGCSAIKKDVFLEVGGIDVLFDPNGVLEDRDIGFKIIKKGKRIRYCPDAKLLHLTSQTGGRREISTQTQYLSDYSLNMFYFLHKHLGENAFNEYKLHLIYVLIKKYGLWSRHFIKSVLFILRFSPKDLMKLKPPVTKENI